jgi:hypothetical protein
MPCSRTALVSSRYRSPVSNPSQSDPPPGTPRRESGLRLPVPPPPGADAFDIAMHYLANYEADYGRARRVVKSRASNVVVGVATANGLIAVVGVAVAVSGWSWLGLVTAGLAGTVGVLSAWDGLFRHRELWVQRSLILGQLQATQREARLRVALGEDRDIVAKDSMTALNGVLAEDLVTWAEIRRSKPQDQRELPTQHADGQNEADS